MSLAFQEQRLYGKLRGRRMVFYAVALATGGMVGVLVLLVGLGVVPGTEARDVSSSILLFVNFFPFIALWDNPGEKRTRLERLSEFCWLWLVLGALIETFWEGTWVIADLTGVIHGATKNSHWLWYWWAYGSADTRYLSNPSDGTVFALEVMAGLCGPFLFYTLWLHRQGRHLKANWFGLILLWALAWADFPFMISEWHHGFDNVAGGWFGFWVIFVGLNVPWMIAPVPLIWGKVLEIRYWYQYETYVKFRDAGADVVMLPATDEVAEPTAARVPVGQAAFQSPPEASPA